MEIYGPEASGKTTLALHVIAEAQKQGGCIIYFYIHTVFIYIIEIKIRVTCPSNFDIYYSMLAKYINLIVISSIITSSLCAAKDERLYPYGDPNN